MEHKEMIKTIAEYDGFTMDTQQGGIFTQPNGDDFYLSGLKYATSYEWLQPVAQRVFRELTGIISPNPNSNTTKYRHMAEIIHDAMLQPIENGQLLKSVYDGICLLKKLVK